VLVAFLISLKKWKRKCLGAQSSSGGTAAGVHWWLKPEDTAVPPAAQEQGGGLAVSLTDAQSWPYSLSLPSPVLPVAAVCVGTAWAGGAGPEWILGPGGTAVAASVARWYVVMGRGSAHGKIIFKTGWDDSPAEVFQNAAARDVTSPVTPAQHPATCFPPWALILDLPRAVGGPQPLQCHCFLEHVLSVKDE